ncbi:MAG: oligosaccharide flippase family protein [Chloroflexi bacterium]|nr:oligosaccharide flippase family protein [Chloroflexota bacterium]
METSAQDSPYDLQLIRRRASLGVGAFALREGLVRFLTLASGVILARLLGPETFGLYAIAWFVVHLFSHFSDAGLVSLVGC